MVELNSRSFSKMQNFLLEILQVNAIFNASDEMHYRECKGLTGCEATI